MATPLSNLELIRSTISGVVIAFDSKNFQNLRNFFTEDCLADYPRSLGQLQGVDSVIAGLQKANGHIGTFHALTTRAIHLTGGNTAEATTYCSAGHFSVHKTFFADARYFDKLVKVNDGDHVKWMISSRQTNMVGIPRGDFSILNMNFDICLDELKGENAAFTTFG
ncbi:small subunit of phenylpropionate dioxygenase protein [Penicillium angulare]|uniref:small subunit of phenylpropionate dioxygenase protein n=1 Tax=Penicillium angulare TaxID=116970 RepID=UPI00253F72BF|nr:small subunit of phenylpropionate dioxygenase protein [Penicillium angulare]KAJ5273170.1 small subunit of phenylpropionate dioxygenase protein [Penicillium angulare]